MSEALRDWGPDSKVRFLPGYVEFFVAPNAFGRVSRPPSNAISLFTATCALSSRGHAACCSVLTREPQSLPQVVVVVVFIVALCLFVGAPLTVSSTGVSPDAIGHFLSAPTVVVAYLMLELSPTNGSRLGVTTRASRLQHAVEVLTLAFTGLVFFHFALKTRSELSRDVLLKRRCHVRLLACLGGTTHCEDFRAIWRYRQQWRCDRRCSAPKKFPLEPNADAK
jgi:hypothetical protein